MGKKRTSTKSDDVVSPSTAEQQVDEPIVTPTDKAPEEQPLLPTATAPAVATLPQEAPGTTPSEPSGASVSPNADATNTTYAKAQQTVETAVNIAKDAVERTVEQIKYQLGEEKTQVAIEYANKAKETVEGAVEIVKETVDTRVNEVKGRVNDVKERATERVTETVEQCKTIATEKAAVVKEKAAEEYTHYKAVATEKAAVVKEKAAETAEHYKSIAAAKTEKPRQKATEVVAWLKGDVEETPLEHTAVDFTSFLLSTTLSVGSSALGLVGLDKKAANVVTTARTRAAELIAQAPLVGRAHNYASEFWPYRLVARMAVNVDAKIMGRAQPSNPKEAAVPTEAKEAAPAPVTAADAQQ